MAARARRGGCRVSRAAWAGWFDEHRIAAVIEPTIPMVAPVRGDGYEHAGTDYAMISLTHFWDWTGFPVVSIPSGVGAASGLPVGVSLVGRAASDWFLLDLGEDLQGDRRRQVDRDPVQLRTEVDSVSIRRPSKSNTTASTSTAFWIAWRTLMSCSAGFSTFMPSHT